MRGKVLFGCGEKSRCQMTVGEGMVHMVIEILQLEGTVEATVEAGKNGTCIN